MRYATVFAVLFAAMTLQSCRIEMPSLIHLISDYNATIITDGPRPNPYNFGKSKAVNLQSNFKGTLILGDRESFHAENMRNIMLGVRIPEKNIVLFENFGYIGDGNDGLRLLISGDHEKLRKVTRVVVVPLFTPLREPVDAPRVMSTNILFVLGTGNMLNAFEEDRDMYNSNHIRWSRHDPEINRRLKMYYQAILDVYSTGKAIAATSAHVTEAGEVEPDKYVVQCGDIKESCYTFIPAQPTSPASTRLSTVSFYLAQFYETPEAIIDVLQECAIDIGEPGVDREYGRGVVNLLCPRVLDKELEIVGRYLEQERKKELPQGGDLVGIWRAEKTELQVHIPQVLKETVQTTYSGTVTGTLVFTETAVTADFSVQASVSSHFLLPAPIEAKVTDTVQEKGIYTIDQDTLLTLPSERSFIYRATEDSLHVTRQISLIDALRLLPGHFGSMAERYGKEILRDDPLAISMRFKRVSPPGIPGNVRETSSTDSTLTLAWETPKETEGLDIERYRITQYTDNTCTTDIKITETAKQALQFTNLTDNTAYYFTVEAKTSAGWGTPSHCLVVTTEQKRIPGDFDNNQVVDFADFLLFVRAFGSVQGDAAFNERMDLVPDGMINFADFIMFIEIFDKPRNS